MGTAARRVFFSFLALILACPALFVLPPSRIHAENASSSRLVAAAEPFTPPAFPADDPAGALRTCCIKKGPAYDFIAHAQKPVRIHGAVTFGTREAQAGDGHDSQDG
jgi:hypothetical protein